MRGVLAIGVVLGACGFKSTLPAGIDAGIDPTADGAIDAPDAACMLGAFSAPVPIDELNTAVHDQPGWLRDDELVMIFTSDRAGASGRDLWVAMRSLQSDPFEPATRIPMVNSAAEDAQPWLSADGLALYFASDRGAPGDLDLFVAERTATNQPFSPAMKLPAAVNSARDDFFPVLSKDGMRLYFSSLRANGTGSYDLYVSARSPMTMEFLEPVPIAALNTIDGEAGFALSHDELTLYLESNPGGGGYDVWTASRPALGQPFGALSRVASVSTAGTDIPRWLSPDGNRLYLSIASAPGDNTTADIFVATRTCN